MAIDSGQNSESLGQRPKRGIKAFKKATLIAILLGGTLGFSAGAAYATNTQSLIGQFSTGGRTYQTLAALDTTWDGGRGSAASFIYAQGGDVPVGWMYARGRAFIGGNFCDEGWEAYNGIVAHQLDNGVWLSCGYGAYQSYGVVGAWNGNSYNYYYPYRTPAAYGGL